MLGFGALPAGYFLTGFAGFGSGGGFLTTSGDANKNYYAYYFCMTTTGFTVTSNGKGLRTLCPLP